MRAQGCVLLATDSDDHHFQLANALAGHAGLVLRRLRMPQLAEPLAADADLLLVDLPDDPQVARQLVMRVRRLTDERLAPLLLLAEDPSAELLAWCLEQGAEDLLAWASPPLLIRGRISAAVERRRLRARVREQSRRIVREKLRTDSLVSAMAQLGVMFSAERDFGRLLERVLLEAKSFCGADAGTLYLRSEDDQLHFKIVRTDSLEIALGGATGKEISFAPLSLYEPDGEPNHRFVVTSVALTGRSINIPDAYTMRGFDFSGTREFDRQTGYRSKSFLTVPLKNDLGRVIGVLQLINAQDPDSRVVIPFDPRLERMVESLSSLAAAALESYVREQGLRREIEALRIEIDDTRKARQVAEITETEYFTDLQRRVRQLRGRA